MKVLLRTLLAVLAIFLPTAASSAPAYYSPVANTAALQALGTSSPSINQAWIKNVGLGYTWNGASTATPATPGVIQATGVTTGRWLLDPTSSTYWPGATMIINSPGGQNLQFGNGSGQTVAQFQWLLNNGWAEANWYLKSNQPSRGDWCICTGAQLFNGVYEPVMSIGYNADTRGIPIVSGEPADSWNIEPHYFDGVNTVTEIYNQYLDHLGIAKRPIFWQIDNTTGNMLSMWLMGPASQGVQFTVDDGTGTGNPVGRIGLAYEEILGQTGLDTSLALDAISGHTSILRMGFSGNNNRFTVAPGSNFVQFVLGSRDVLDLWDTPNGGAGSAGSIGCAINTATLTLCANQDAMFGLAVRRNSGTSSANILETENQSGTPLGLTVSATGVVATTGAASLGGALTYAGVTFANSVTGTGSLVGATSPTLTTPTVSGNITLLGSSSGSTQVQAPATGGGTAIFPAGSGTLVYAAGAVTAITGTANQVTASASTGAVTLSLPSTLTIPGTLTVVGTEIVSGNGAASISNVLWNGTVFTGGTGTTNFPAMLVQPAGTTPVTTWSTSGTIFGINAPSGFTGRFFDLYSGGGTSLLSVSGTGGLTAAGPLNTTINRVVMTGSPSAAAWTTNGRGLIQSSGTWTDTSSSGTVTAEYINVLQAPTFAFSNATTITNAYNTYFVDPVQGTNATLTNKYAIGADSFRIAGAAFNAPGLGTSSAATSGTLCWTVTTGLVNVDTTLACLASLEELKNISGPINGGYALSVENKLKPFWFGWKPGTPEYFGDRHQQPGLGAHATEAVDARLVAYGTDGKLKGVRYQEIAALHTAAIQELSRDIDSLRAANALLHAANDNDRRDILALKISFDRLQRCVRVRR